MTFHEETDALFLFRSCLCVYEYIGSLLVSVKSTHTRSSFLSFQKSLEGKFVPKVQKKILWPTLSFTFEKEKKTFQIHFSCFCSCLLCQNFFFFSLTYTDVRKSAISEITQFDTRVGNVFSSFSCVCLLTYLVPLPSIRL